MGISISDVNPDHLPEDVRAGRTTKHGFTINFFECTMDESTKDTLFKKLKTQYGAVGVENHNAPPDKVDKDPDYTIVKVTINNEIGSLNRILQAFQDLKINIHGINVLQPAFCLEKAYKEYHLEITATNEQEANLKKRLLAEGLAIYFTNQTESAGIISRPDASLNAGTESNAESKLDITPTAKIIQFVMKDEVGTLGNALQIFNELGINITRINRAHLLREHQDEFVVCSCPEDQRESLISKLKSYGATNAEEVKHVDTNDCVVKFSVVREVGSTIKVLKAFSDMGVEILKINPSNIKVHNQYVECCCTEDEQKETLRRLEEVVGVIDVALIAEPESLVSVKPTEDPNYCIIKYSVDEKAGTIVRALRVFFNLKINIIGVNTLNPAFDRTFPVKYKHHHVVLIATDDEVEELKRELPVTRLALDVRPYNRIKHSDNLEALQSGNVDGNDIALTSDCRV